MSYYWFNRQEILQKAREKYSNEKAAEYYLRNKKVIKEKARKTNQNKRKIKLKSIKKTGTKNWFSIKKKR